MINPTAVFIHAGKPPFTHLFRLEGGGEKERIPATLKKNLDGTFAIFFPAFTERSHRLRAIAGRYPQAVKLTLDEWVFVDAEGRELPAKCIGKSRRAKLATVSSQTGGTVGEVFCYPAIRGGWKPSTAMHCLKSGINLGEVLKELRFSPEPFSNFFPLFENQTRKAPGGFSIALDRRKFWELPACISGFRGEIWARVKDEWRLAPEFFY